MGEEPKPAQIEETHTLATNEEGDAVETTDDGDQANGEPAEDG